MSNIKNIKFIKKKSNRIFNRYTNGYIYCHKTIKNGFYYFK